MRTERIKALGVAEMRKLLEEMRKLLEMYMGDNISIMYLDSEIYNHLDRHIPADEEIFWNIMYNEILL